jgi:RND family efflux transporter MFP subunit
MTSHRLVTSTTLIGFALIGAAGCTTRVQTADAKPPRPVKVQQAMLAPAEGGIRYSATIEAFQTVPLAFKSSGYVDHVVERPGADGRRRVAQAGDKVTKGMTLAHVRDADYRERLAQGNAKQAEANAALTKARLDLDRAKTLFAAESLTKPDLDAAQASFDAAQARVAAARADLELASIALRDTTLVAPASGVLLERKIEVGSLVSAGSVGFLLGDVSAVKARFGIPDSMIRAITPGDSLSVGVDAIGGAPFEGRVTSLAPAADPQSRVFDVEVTIPNKAGTLRPGMIGAVTIDTNVHASSTSSASATTTPAAATARGDAAHRLTVPLTAIVRAPGDTPGYALLVVESKGDTEIARLRRVELGDVLGNGVAVINGLAAGDRVIVTGATLLTDGDAVRVIP